MRHMTAGVLFCAFAAEAYVNRFLAERLSEPDAAAVDRLAPVDKYVVAVPHADPNLTFPRDKFPAGRLRELFAFRNALVHHKPARPPRGELDPCVLAEFVIAVGTAAHLLAPNEVRPLLIKKDAGHLREWGRKCKKAPPPRLGRDAHPPDLMVTAFRRHFGDRLDVLARDE